LEPEGRFYTCGYCGQRHFALHSKWEMTIRDLPAFGRKVYLHLSQWRVECSCRQKPVNEVRREEQQRYSKEGKHLLKGSRFLLLKGEERLSPASRAQLSELLSLNENLFKAYLLKEEFRQLYRLRDENLSDERHYREGFRRFIRWAEKVKESGLESFRRVLKTFTRRLWGILNFLRTGLTNGLSGGLNNAIATLKKMAYGYRDEEFFILKIYQRARLI